MELLDLRAPNAHLEWSAVHDVVMGGESRGEVVTLPPGLRFQGVVSLGNGGGFASFRRAGRLPDLVGWRGLRLGLRGDGHAYELGLRSEDLADGVRWRGSFATVADEWTHVELAFGDLTAARRGRPVLDVPPFDPARIVEVRILIGARQPGPFRLDLATVGAWR